MDFSDLSVATLNVNGMNNYNKSSHSAGVAVWMRACLAPYIDNVSADDEGRLVTVRLVREQRAITISSLYAPVDFTRRLAFFSRHLPVLASSGCFVFGDFNTVLSPSVDRRGGAPCARADGVSRDLRSALAAGDFVDVYRRFFPSMHSRFYLAQAERYVQ